MYIQYNVFVDDFETLQLQHAADIFLILLWEKFLANRFFFSFKILILLLRSTYMYFICTFAHIQNPFVILLLLGPLILRIEKYTYKYSFIFKKKNQIFMFYNLHLICINTLKFCNLRIYDMIYICIYVQCTIVHVYLIYKLFMIRVL